MCIYIFVYLWFFRTHPCCHVCRFCSKYMKTYMHSYWSMYCGVWTCRMYAMTQWHVQNAIIIIKRRPWHWPAREEYRIILYFFLFHSFALRWWTRAWFHGVAYWWVQRSKKERGRWGVRKKKMKLEHACANSHT